MEMQSHSHHRSKRGGATAVQEQEGEDRLSRLPDDILHSILRGLPLKHAARTSTLSRRWARTWLRALASSRVLDFTDSVVSSCRALEHLSLRSCGLLRSVRIARDTLRALEVVRCPAVRELRVNAPALESFAFHGDLVCSSDDEDLSSAVDLGSTPPLRDAYLSHIGFDDEEEEDREYAYSSFLSCVAHARALTLCSVGLLHLWAQLGYDPCMEIDMTNIQELQLLLLSSSEGEDDGLESFSCFFQTYPLPLLDRLFLRLPSHATDATDAAAALPGEVADDSKMMIHGHDFVLGRLSFIKLVNFRGTRFELQLHAFLLRRAPALEQLVLVTLGEEHGGAPGDESLEEVIQGWVSAMRKASPLALTVCRSSQDRSQNHVHTRFYHEE